MDHALEFVICQNALSGAQVRRAQLPATQRVCLLPSYGRDHAQLVA